jgi:DNA-binding NarL/FixJ family response regulator
MVSVLIADDQALIRTGFRLQLDGVEGISVVGEAGDGAEAVARTQRLRPDVVLMDVRMPVMDGIEATRRITATSTSRVLILTTFDLDEYAFDGLSAGASGFLLKDVRPQQLYDAINAVALGDAVLSPRITRDLVDRFAVASRRTVEREPGTSTAALRELTQREREVYDQIANGLSNAEIGARLHLTEATVKTHITRVLAKLGLRDRVQVVIHAYEHGLR